MKSTTYIYPRLSPTAAAMVAWGLMYDGNDGEAERVASAVPREYRIGPVAEFGNVIVWLQAIAQYWTVMHWKMTCAYEQEKTAFALAVDDADLMARGRLLGEAEGRLIACDGALDAAAHECGFDAETVRHLAAAVRFVPVMPGAASDAALEHEVLAVLMRGQPAKASQ